MRKRVGGRVSGLLVGLLLATGPAAAQCVDPGLVNPCVPGGGSPATDCHLEWVPVPVPNLDRKGVPENDLVCYEGDPRCDVDPDLANGSCTMRTVVCINNDDPRLSGCDPTNVASFELLQPPVRSNDPVDTANRAALEAQFGGFPTSFGVTVRRGSQTVFAGSPNASENLCGGPVDLLVPLRRGAGDRLRRGALRVTARTTNVLGRFDLDRISFECRPSTCGDGVVDRHETCDDGNRNNGDGCDQGCQLPSLTPTPTGSAPPTWNFTATPTPVPPATPTPQAGEVRLLPGGGTSRSCRGVCAGGVIPGGSCGGNVDCGAGGSCVSRACVGGPLDGTSCTAATQCNGCSLNPQQGSCVTVQNQNFPIVVPLNGVCVPRLAPDVACVSDAECPSGKTCQLPGFVLQVGATDPSTQEAALALPAAQSVFSPVSVPGIGWVCVSVPADGVGVVDCDGGRPDLNVSVAKDHNTSPGHSGNGPGGLPDDPECDDVCPLPGGGMSMACVEGTGVCVGGDNAGLACTSGTDCPDGTCELCNPVSPHAGVCNSPTCTASSGAFAAGDLHVAVGLAVTLPGTQPGSLGPDGLACTADDVGAGTITATPVLLGSGTTEVTIFDAGNVAGSVVGPGAQCGPVPCVASVSGAGASCQALASGQTAGLVVAGGAAQLDLSAGDVATTFRFVAR